MVEEDGVPYHVKDPIAEILAIKFFEHDCRRDGNETGSWFDLDAERREMYRAMARGEEPSNL